MKNKVKYINRNLFYSPYYIGLCLSEKAFHKALKKLGIKKADLPAFLNPGAHATVHEVLSDNGGKIALVCLGDCTGRSLNEIHGLLVHEAMHIWRWIKEDIGEKQPSSEFEAYSMQSICQNLFDAYEEMINENTR